MNVIVPLAGPDFIRSDGTIKALMPYRGTSFLKYTLDSRQWASNVSQYSFVLYDCERSRAFARDCLVPWYPTACLSFISRYSRGAAISALTAMSAFRDFSLPLVVDLADIVYSSNFDYESCFCSDSTIGGIAPVFKSNRACYSYLLCDSSGDLVYAAEKRVISTHASAGTYIFRDSSLFLKACAHALDNEDDQTHLGLFYVCPMLNGVVAESRRVILAHVSDVHDIKTRAQYA